MRKSQIGVDTFIALVILVLGILVLFLVVYPDVKELLVGEGEKGACEWSLVMHSITKIADWSAIPAECRAHRFEVDLKYLQRYHTEAKKRIDVYEADADKYQLMLEELEKSKQKIGNDPDPNYLLNEWALNKIVAEEMKDCWQKVFMGELPLFDQWWDFYSWEKEMPTRTKDRFSSFIGNFEGPPTNCIICSRIKFSPDLVNYFKRHNKVNIDSIDTWLKNNHPAWEAASYYKFLIQGQSELKSFFTPDYSYSIDKPLAVLYEKIYYYHGIEEVLDRLWKLISGGKEGSYDLNFLKLVPYTQEDLIHPPNEDRTGGEGCTFILD